MAKDQDNTFYIPGNRPARQTSHVTRHTSHIPHTPGVRRERDDGEGNDAALAAPHQIRHP